MSSGEYLRVAVRVLKRPGSTGSQPPIWFDWEQCRDFEVWGLMSPEEHGLEVDPPVTHQLSTPFGAIVYTAPHGGFSWSNPCADYLQWAHPYGHAA